MKKIILLALVVGSPWVAVACGGKYVAHEWGTFTSVQGADGVQLEWNPFVPAELPRFVYGQAYHGANLLLKSDIVARQRMETPVIYFYSETPRTVNVTVGLPGGKITEWYPQANNGKTTKWMNVRVLPQREGALPSDSTGSHYYAARETAANLLQVNKETEKFIFYRGVASFTAPLRVMVGGVDEDVLHLQNTGTEPLRHFYVVQIRNGAGKFQAVGNMPAGEARRVKLEPGSGAQPLSDFQNGISTAMQQALVKEGLYEAEAVAMVKTWRDSWFGEDGIRVLYVLPRTWTDRTLPLTIEPPPREIARVMVGRAEVILPSQEWKLLKQIVRYSEAGPDERPAIVNDTRSIGLGRFADAAVRRLLGTTASKDFNANAWAVVDAAKDRKEKSLAAR